VPVGATPMPMPLPTGVRLRAASADDAPALAAIHARAIGALDTTYYTTAELAAWAARMPPERYRALLPTRRITVAEIATAGNPRIVGYAQLLPDEGVIEAVYVDPDFGRRGIGAALVRAVEDDGRALGLPGLVLDATLNSIAFYAALGYRQECLAHHELAPGVRIACAVMEKRLEPRGVPTTC
jgi:ribosomal protein S18 acetylase RimI-like enzyme